MKDLEDKYDINPEDFCRQVPVIYSDRIYTSSYHLPMEILNDKRFVDQLKSNLHSKDQIDYVKELLWRISDEVADLSVLRGILSGNPKHGVSITSCSEGDYKILNRIFNIKIPSRKVDNHK